MAIDWNQIETIDDLGNIDTNLLFEEEIDSDLTGYELNPNLTEEEIEDALFWINYLRGLMLVTGPPGSGKGVFSHMFSYKMGYYFNKVKISDSRPYPLFGKYLPFSQEFLVDQLDRMGEVATGQIKNTDPEYKPKYKPHITKDGRWFSSWGEVFIRRSVWLLDEFGAKYMHKREPHQPIKRQLLKMFTIWRHLQAVILGVGTEMADFDNSCFPKVTCECRCMRLTNDPFTNTKLEPQRLMFAVSIHPLKFISATGELDWAGRKQVLVIDADKPRDMLGGKAWKDLYNHENAIALEPIKSLRKKQ